MLKESGAGKVHNFQPISRRISETVQDMTEVTINMTSRKSEVAYALSIGAKINDLGLPYINSGL